MVWQSILSISVIVALTTFTPLTGFAEEFKPAKPTLFFSFGTFFDDVKSFFAPEKEPEIWKVKSADNNIFDNIWNDILTFAEIGTIKELYFEGKTCKLTCSTAEKEEFNQKVMELNSWKTRCSGEFDLDNFEYTDVGFDKLAETNCPDLHRYPKSEILKVFNEG